jgi:hypothetical protein
VFLYSHCITGRSGRRDGAVSVGMFYLRTLWLHYSINAIVDEFVQLSVNHVALFRYARLSFIFLLVARALGYQHEKVFRSILR